MQYISPFSLLQPIGMQELNSGNISLAKKMLLAELDLAGSGTISINSHELTKNDILLLIDGLQPKSSINYHKAVAADVALRNFLENGVLENGIRFKREVFYDDPQFIEWLSPYYFISFSKLSVECISAKLVEKWDSLMLNPLLMNTGWAEKAWAIIEELVNKDLIILRDFIGKKKLKRKHQLEPIISTGYIGMLKLLPDERFFRLKDEYAYLMMQHATQIFNTLNKQDAIAIISRALSLAVSTDIQEAIGSTRGELSRNYRIWQKSKQDRLARKIAFVGVLIFMVCLFWKSWSEPTTYDTEQNEDDSAMHKTLPATSGNALNTTDSLKSAIPRVKSSDATKKRSH